MRLLPILVATFACAALLPSTVRADDCKPSCGRGARHATSQGMRSAARASHAHDPRHRATRSGIARNSRGARYGACRRRAGGGSWAELRRYLPEGRETLERLRVRAYFLSRYPFALTDPDDEADSVATLLEIGDDEAGSERVLDAAGHLDRGVARFHVADYAGAKEDFLATLAERPEEARARWGLMMVALCTSDVAGAAGGLDALAKTGELRRGDRLSAEDTFSDASKWNAIVQGLRSYAQYQIMDGRAHVVAAWALAVSGNDVEARRYLRLAKRWDGPPAAVAALETMLAPETAQAETAPARAADRRPGTELAKR